MKELSVRDVLVAHSRRYPKMQVQDAVKLLYQSEFGGGHMILDEANSLLWLEEEWRDIKTAPGEVTEQIGGGLCRLHLAPLKNTGLSAATINRLFVNTAKEVQGTSERIDRKLETFRQCCREGVFCFTAEEAESYLQIYCARGCPAVHHSEIFRALYAPAYRVVQAAYGKFLPLFIEIDKRLSRANRLNIAIDGNCAAGKSTLALLLRKIYDCNVIPMDDFFLPPALRTRERLEEPGGNIDYIRFYNEVTLGLESGEAFSYQAYDCTKEAFTRRVAVQKKSLNIVEGVYCLHPRLARIYGLKVFLYVSSEEQHARIVKRNSPALQQRFFYTWIPLEEAYFNAFSIPETCDLVLEG